MISCYDQVYNDYLSAVFNGCLLIDPVIKVIEKFIL